MLCPCKEKIWKLSWSSFAIFFLNQIHSSCPIAIHYHIFLQPKWQIGFSVAVCTYMYEEILTDCKAVVDMLFVNTYVNIRNILTHWHKFICVYKANTTFDWLIFLRCGQNSKFFVSSTPWLCLQTKARCFHLGFAILTKLS